MELFSQPVLVASVNICLPKNEEIYYHAQWTVYNGDNNRTERMENDSVTYRSVDDAIKELKYT